MHWNVPPDALPGSATFVLVLDRWLNDCIFLSRDHSVPKLYSYLYGLDRDIYSHLYSLLEFYLAFYVKKTNKRRSCCSFDRSVAKHDESKSNCCARCPRVPVVKLIDLVCGFLVQPTSTKSCTQLYKHGQEIARDLDSVACPSKWPTNLGIGWPWWPPILKTLFCPLHTGLLEWVWYQIICSTYIILKLIYCTQYMA